ncbi:MAG: AbrB/MazE/SpoVT family DNA-binding domain-containing protein [bacterium]
MRVQVQKWGNSLAIRIPKSFAKETKIEQGTVVDLSAVKGTLIAKPINEYEYSLEELLAGVTKENLHAEVDTGDAIGQEVW